MTHPPTNCPNMATLEFSLVSLVLPPRTRLTPEWRHSETLESLALLALFGLKKTGLSPISSSGLVRASKISNKTYPGRERLV